MNIESLESRRTELRATMSGDMSTMAFRAVQARVDMITLAITKIEAADAAKLAADQAVEEVMKWAI